MKLNTIIISILICDFQILKNEQDKEEADRAAIEEKMKTDETLKKDEEDKKRDEEKRKKDEEEKKKEEEEVSQFNISNSGGKDDFSFFRLFKSILFFVN